MRRAARSSAAPAAHASVATTIATGAATSAPARPCRSRSRERAVAGGGAERAAGDDGNEIDEDRHRRAGARVDAEWGAAAFAYHAVSPAASTQYNGGSPDRPRRCLPIPPSATPPHDTRCARSSPRRSAKSPMPAWAEADVLPFWFGEPDEVTPAFIRDAAAASLARGETFYTQNFGIPELREAIARLCRPAAPARPAPSSIAVTASGMSALMLIRRGAGRARRSRRGRHAAVAEPGRDSEDPRRRRDCVSRSQFDAAAGRSTSTGCSTR